MISFPDLNMLFSPFSLFFPVKNMGQCQCSCLIGIEIPPTFHLSSFAGSDYCSSVKTRHSAKAAGLILKQPKFWVLFPCLCPDCPRFSVVGGSWLLLKCRWAWSCKALCAAAFVFALEILARMECAWIWEVRKCVSKGGGEPLLSFEGAQKPFYVPQTCGSINGNTKVAPGCRLGEPPICCDSLEHVWRRKGLRTWACTNVKQHRAPRGLQSFCITLFIILAGTLVCCS